MTVRELQAAKLAYAAAPFIGDEVLESGGVRKGRYVGRGKGKSGGYRIVAVAMDKTIPVYLIGVLSKGDRVRTITDNEVKAFKRMTDAIKEAHRKRGRK